MDLGGQGETSGINKDKTESILTTVEALQPTSAWCLPQPLRSDCTDTDGERSLLSVQHPAAAPTQGNSPNKVSCKCCFLATREPHKKSCLPVCLGTSSKQLVQKVHVKISSLTLMAFAIYRVKESFSSPCFFPGSGTDAVEKRAFADRIPFNVPFHLSHLQNQCDFPTENRCWNAVWEDPLSLLRETDLSGGQRWGSTWGRVQAMQRLKAVSFNIPELGHTASTMPQGWSNRVQLYHQSQLQERGRVGVSPSQRGTFCL